EYIAPIQYHAVGEPGKDLSEAVAEHHIAAGCSYYNNYYPNAEYLNEYYKLKVSPPEEFQGWMFENFTEYFTEVPVEKLRELPYYDSKTENYIILEDFCFGEERYPVVTNVFELGDDLSIFYDIIDSEGNVIGSRELVIKTGAKREYLGCYERE
ncbi:MAG: hypothetical protein IKU42_03935, partial [Oscillospiraceae bacterium]|nr:hypothetical protein [Oscillospiraceae bacterium]